MQRLAYRMAIALASAAGAFAAPTPLLCEAVGDPLALRSEGITERVGIIVVRCTGAPGGTVTGGISVVMSAPVTNKLSGETIDATLVADTEVGLRNIGGAPLLLSRNNIFFAGFTFNVPANGETTFRISNIRVDPGNTETPVTAFLSTTGTSGIGIRNNPVTVGVPRRGLLANGSATRIVCLGSNLPDEITFQNLLLTGTKFATARVTEGTPTGFEPRQANASNGVRVMIRYSGFPGQARLFVPDFIAGSSSARQTSAGDLGVEASGGWYLAGPEGALLLGRVNGVDAAGAGGAVPAAPVSSTPILLNSVSEVSMRNGSGVAVFEVLDSVASAFESAQIPTFVYLPPSTGYDGLVATAQISFAPISTVTSPSSTAPVNRFRDVPPQLDCNVVRDCNASYFPRLFVDPPQTFAVTAPNVAGFYQKFLRVLNDRGGLMNWTTNIAYRSGANWLKIFPEAGINNASLNLSYFPEKLAPGAYEAVLTVDAGPLAGTRAFTVTLTVTPAPPAQPGGSNEPPKPAADPPRFWSVGNAAQIGVPSLVPGSLATLEGAKLSGRIVKVTFDGVEAAIVSGAESKITVIVPQELTGRPAAQLVVTVDGVASASQAVPLAVTAPAIFPNSVFNEDGFANKPDNPANSGTVLQIFATGLPLPSTGTMAARIHDRVILNALYAGNAPGSPGVQQMNLRIPEDLPAMTTEVRVCGVTGGGVEATCSLPATITIR